MKNRLRELRELKNLTQEDIANRVGVSRQTIISLEKGKYNPSILLAFKLARIFGLPVEEIFIHQEESED
ncbi:MAG: helix-turn-helix transcriptional regulator [Syntrophomonadaceae bacterium]|nr:helix-turn-helix transcriptional regulator [Syntrophomonadaceae bacterium]